MEMAVKLRYASASRSFEKLFQSILQTSQFKYKSSHLQREHLSVKDTFWIFQLIDDAFDASNLKSILNWTISCK